MGRRRRHRRRRDRANRRSIRRRPGRGVVVPIPPGSDGGEDYPRTPPEVGRKRRRRRSRDDGEGRRRGRRVAAVKVGNARTQGPASPIVLPADVRRVQPGEEAYGRGTFYRGEFQIYSSPRLFFFKPRESVFCSLFCRSVVDSCVIFRPPTESRKFCDRPWTFSARIEKNLILLSPPKILSPGVLLLIEPPLPPSGHQTPSSVRCL